MGSYHPSSQNWWLRQSLYVGPSGMNYLPHFAILFTPFDLLPLAVGEILWRFCAAATLATGLWFFSRELFSAKPEHAFLWATVLAMPLSLGALRNGNANAIFGGVTLLAIVAILRERWWLAIVWMALATALKPLGIVLLLLSSIYYLPAARRLPAAILALAIFPFFFGRPTYVESQYHEAWRNLGACAVVTENRFADFNGLLRTLGAPVPPKISTIVRALAGAATALAWLWGARRLQPALRALWLYALTAGYLMLFNPMTETNSYVIFASALGIWGTYFLVDEDLARRRLGWTIAVMALSMPILPNIFRPIFGNYFALVWFPAVTLVFLATLTAFAARPIDAKAQSSS
jgi:hypothetical protein